ncbi:MAG TPA: molybdate ABC transporter substrate-binding protein [Vicinamibacterales bacterium]|nr:molybdate ABC transporter substrate-binding protein [Vicinamibacterales bacterium]
MMRIVLLLAVVAGAWLPDRGEPPMTVSAAISLTNALEEIVNVYERAGGGPVRLNLAGSNALARQIVNGAPVDVFISADEAQMTIVERAGRVAPGTRVDLLGNQLAVVAAPERATFVGRRFGAAPPEIRRLAIGDPAAVPAGVYAREYLEKTGLWKAYAPRIVPTINVRAALTAVESGGADAAIVYLTDTVIATRAVVAMVVPAAQGPRIVYPAAVIASSQVPDAARRFLAFLRGPEASAIFTRHRFLPAPGR